MPIPLTHPGVYIQEVSSGVRTITGVATSITAFVGYFARGPFEQPVQLLSLADFDRVFGGLQARSEASYAIHQFFRNGGAEAWVVRTASAARAFADVEILSTIGGAVALKVNAINPGSWGGAGSGLQGLRVSIGDPAPSDPARFTLSVALVESVGGREQLVASESFFNLSMDPAAPSFVAKVVNDATSGSRLFNVTASGNQLPLLTGTLSGALPSPLPSITSTAPKLLATISGLPPATVSLASVPTSLEQARQLLEQALQAAAPAQRAFAQARVQLINNQLRVLCGPTAPASTITFAAASSDTTTVKELKLDGANGAIANVQAYRLGAGSAVTGTGQGAGKAGNDGDPPGVSELVGAMRKLDDLDLFNILCIPRASQVSGSDPLDADPVAARTKSATLIQAATNYCADRRAIFLVDPPSDVTSVEAMKTWVESNGDLRSRNAALYFPRLRIADPLDDFRLRSIGPCGTIAGLYARTDSDRGVWKAPAGTEATLINVRELALPLNDGLNGVLNPIAINCLRSFPSYGKVCWGARTLDGSDQRASEWKYVPVRRLALFLEESLYRGTQWVVFEPNDEPLWAQIRLNIGAFLQNLFRQGAFQGRSPREAYFVKCDRETTTQNDINQGVVNILVGFAPLKPAEFVVIRFQQIAGQIDT